MNNDEIPHYWQMFSYAASTTAAGNDRKNFMAVLLHEEDCRLLEVRASRKLGRDNYQRFIPELSGWSNDMARLMCLSTWSIFTGGKPALFGAI